ncbi:MAG: hypothetical protein ISP46_04225 [Alphaproteobacteria bacterium]|nr:hypothetical protein [Alphaproteobacteria bacterium]
MFRHIPFAANNGKVQAADGLRPIMTSSDFVIIDTADCNLTKAGIFAIDMADHIRFRFWNSLMPMRIMFLSAIRLRPMEALLNQPLRSILWGGQFGNFA